MHVGMCLPRISYSESYFLNKLEIGGDPENQRGYLIATIHPEGNPSKLTTGPVCGPIKNYKTAWYSCLSIGWLTSTGYGDISSFGYKLYI